jgi:RNA polymerase-binding transcription factor
MAIEHSGDNGRLQALRDILNHERTLAMERVREYRHDQEDEATPPPGDEMDVARSLAEVETHASLIERAEDRLKAIDFAFDRLEHGRYGICAQCGEQIPVQRLEALPFAGYCVDCQEKRNHLSRSGKPWIDEPFIRNWEVPEEMAETTETSRDELAPLPPEEDLAIAKTLSREAGGAKPKKPKARSRRSHGSK